MAQMQAYVIHEPGDRDRLQLQTVNRPEWKPGWVLIRNRAFGLNRAEWFTRKGASPSVRFPRIIGIECCGEVVQHDDARLKEGQKVVAMMGGMGRDFDGSYAEFALVPKSSVYPIQANLDWETIAALPEMLQTTHGSLFNALEVDRMNNLLVSGGTSSIGLCALALGKHAQKEVTVTSRSEEKTQELKDLGADHVLVDDGQLAEKVSRVHAQGFDCVLELVGTTTLADSLACVKPGGIVCMTGILGGKWALESFEPMTAIPSTVKLTAYSGEASDISAEQLQNYLELVEQGRLQIKTGPIFPFSELKEAHRLMDENRMAGKMVVVM